jgi:ribosome-binding factor A
LAERFARGDGFDATLDSRAVTVSEVQVSPDLRVATCYVAPLGGGDPKPLLAALRRSKSALRAELGRRLTTKFTPDLRFEADVSFDQASGVDAILKSDAVRRDLTRGEDENEDEDEADGT